MATKCPQNRLQRAKKPVVRELTHTRRLQFV
jgi:hypothetical protein